MPDDVRVV